jgi:hypothetical protein
VQLTQTETIEDVAVEQAILHNAPWDLDVSIAPARGMTARFLAQLGAASFRQGDFAAAARAWALVDDRDDSDGEKIASIVRPWRALALARTGDLDGALALAGDGTHLRGEILCALGRFDEGLASIAKARTEDDALCEWRILRHARWLRRAGRPREAGEALDARLEKIARFQHRLHAEALAAWTEAGDPERARSHREAIAQATPGLARAVDGTALDGLEWLPHDLATLAREVASRGLEIVFVNREISTQLHEGIETGPSAPMGVLPGRAMWSALADAREYVVVAESLARPSRGAIGGDTVARWLAHPARPGKLYLCLSGRIPAFLWPEIDATVDGIAGALALYGERLPVDEPRLSDLTERQRIFIGASAVPSPYSGELEDLGFHTFARVAVMSPFLESYPWGGEHAEDPHRLFVDRGGLDGMLAMRETSGQADGRPLVESYRTQHSRSIFSLEQHRAGWVIEFVYRKTPHPEQTRAINARFGTAFPEDLPLDCVGLLMHFDPAFSLDDLKASVAAGAAIDERWRVYAVGALWHESVALDDWLRTLPAELAANADDVAWFYNHLAFLVERALDRPDLREPLQTGPFPSAIRPPDGEYADEADEDDEYADEEDAE